MNRLSQSMASCETLVLDYIKKMRNNKNLSLKDLTLKSVVLVASTLQERIQTIVSIS